MALASFSLSLLIQVHEAAAVWWRAAAVLASSGGHYCTTPRRSRQRQRRVAYGASRTALARVTVCRLTLGYGAVRGLLLVEVRLRFPNVYARPTRVRRASQVPQGRVPPGVHGEAR